MKRSQSERAFLAPRFRWWLTLRLFEVMIFRLESLAVKDLALVVVLSSDLPSTMMTSKSLNVWLDKSLRRLPIDFSSFRAGIMMEREGFGLVMALLYGVIDSGVKWVLVI